jgi:hypothetical protein
MDTIQILLNLGYIFMLAAFTIRDILWLRFMLISAQLSLFSYGTVTGNMAVAFWNMLFLLINTYQAIRLIRERRPIDLPEELLELYDKLFATMRRREFLYLWNMGVIRTAKDVLLVKKGIKQKKLLLILSGTVSVKDGDREIARLTDGSFVAEMSFLTGEAATADVYAEGAVRYIAWEQTKLRSLDQLNPDLLIKIQNILGKDLTQKLKEGSGVPNMELSI